MLICRSRPPLLCLIVVPECGRARVRFDCPVGNARTSGPVVGGQGGRCFLGAAPRALQRALLRAWPSYVLCVRRRVDAPLQVLQATTNFRDALTSRVEPVYGLTTMHASLRTFRELSAPAVTDADIKNGTYAFGLIALGKFLLRLPAEVLEDELPRLRITLTTVRPAARAAHSLSLTHSFSLPQALTDTSSDSSLVVREAAAASIIAAQLILRDEAHLFVLLDGLPEDKKNLLAYLFDKHNCRGSATFADPAHSGMEKLEREMRRLDGRTSIAPPTRSPAASPSVVTSS